MLQHGDRVKIERSVLINEDHKAFPHGYFIQYVSPDQAEVELMYIQDRVIVPESSLTFEKKRKTKKS